MILPDSLALTVFAETLCLVLTVIGFWTKLALIPLIITMAVGVFIVHINNGLETIELTLLYLLSYCALLLWENGQYSIDAILKRKA